MERIDDGERRYRVLLLGIGDNTEEKRDSFCKKISEIYGIPFPLLKKITERYPTVLKKNLTLDKAITLAKTLKSFGALVSVEERRNAFAVSLEFQHGEPHGLALESSYLRRTPSGVWIVIGRVRNISEETLSDTWVLIQIFDDNEEILSFEEAPIPINPLPSKEASPFKVVSEEGLPVKRVSLAFKNASGTAVPAVDRRERKEWVEVRWGTDDEEDDLSSSSSLFLEGMERLSASPPNPSVGETFVAETFQPSEPLVPPPLAEEPLLKVSQGENKIPLEEPPNEKLPPFFKDVFPETGSEPAGTVEAQMSLPMTEDIQKIMALGEEKVSIVSSAIQEEEIPKGKNPEPIGKDKDLIVGFEMIETQEQKTEGTIPGGGPALSVSASLPEKEETKKGPVDLMNLEPSPAQRKEMFQEGRFDVSIFEEASKLLEEISKEPVKREKEEPPSFPWIEDFRSSVENYYQKHREPFSLWFNSCRHSEGLDHPYRSALTILTHARFNQKNQSEKALENTQKVFRLLQQSNLSLEQIPPLEGTPFFTAENWRELFFKAIPKLQQVANQIIEKKRWNAPDLERLIQIIPHMGDRNSRLAARWIHELISEEVDIDGSTIPISVGESLYRVGARLGVVDPHFDAVQGKNSIGDLKIQAFARMAFPQFPWKIEEPMTWLGIGTEDGGAGYCLPTQPQCEGCLFQTFCPKLYLDFNPSEKGMTVR
jgi:hypothetical protein